MEPAPYGPFPYLPINSPKRPKIKWPGNKALAFWVVSNIEFFPLNEPAPGILNERIPRNVAKIPSVAHWSYRDYGNRVAVWRMMDVFERNKMRCTVMLNASLCDHHPEIVRAGKDLGWEFMAHGWTNSVRLNEMPPEEERATIKKIFDRIEREIGTRPKGWLSSGMEETWNTLDFLVEQGCVYVSDWNNDDQPYLMDVNGKTMVSLPYAWELNDAPALLSQTRSVEEFEGMVRRTFEVLLREAKQTGSGRVMCIATHPFLIGVPHRIDMFERVLKDISSHPDVWPATGGEIVDHYLKSGATF
jgi:peptidoglycan/xylan/chitin deacetylase (PgdA/CDA1 family)